MVRLKRSIEIRRVAGDFSKLKPIDESEFILRLLTRPEFKGPAGARGEPGRAGDSIIGPQGPQGIQGPPGIDGKNGESIVGPRGRDGVQGENGSKWSSGKGQPSFKGKKGDFYLDTESGDVYEFL